MEKDRPEVINVHTTPQELDPWYLADDPDDNKIPAEMDNANADGNRTIR